YLLASIRLRILPCFFYCCGAHRDLHSFPTRRSSDLTQSAAQILAPERLVNRLCNWWFTAASGVLIVSLGWFVTDRIVEPRLQRIDRKSTRLNSSHVKISYAVFCLKKKTTRTHTQERA